MSQFFGEQFTRLENNKVKGLEGHRRQICVFEVHRGKQPFQIWVWEGEFNNS